jgi:hypothetical protein
MTKCFQWDADNILRPNQGSGIWFSSAMGIRNLYSPWDFSFLVATKSNCDNWQGILWKKLRTVLHIERAEFEQIQVMNMGCEIERHIFARVSYHWPDCRGWHAWGRRLTTRTHRLPAADQNAQAACSYHLPRYTPGRRRRPQPPASAARPGGRCRLKVRRGAMVPHLKATAGFLERDLDAKESDGTQVRTLLLISAAASGERARRDGESAFSISTGQRRWRRRRAQATDRSCDAQPLLEYHRCAPAASPRPPSRSPRCR